MFNDIILISSKPHVSETRYSEVQEEFKRRLGRRIETDVRNRLDPGINFRGHRRAQAVKVSLLDTGKLSIKSDQPEKATLRPDRSQEEGRPVLDREDTVDDLFQPSSGVPKAVQADGQTRIAFRTIRDTDLFNRAQERQDANVKRIVDYAIQSNVVEAMDSAVQDVTQRYPAEAIKSENIPGADQ